MPLLPFLGDRIDPYKNFKFLVYFGDSTDPVAGISQVSALRRTTEVIEHRSGGDPSTVIKTPGRTSYEPITLQRGVTTSTVFVEWANLVWNFGSGLGAEVSLKDFRRDIRIALLNEAGQVVLQYNVYRCWVSEFEAMPELNSNANAIAIEMIRLEHEGWERDFQYVTPEEPAGLNPLE